ncbi:hypothetical protein HA466_0293410 [Hirschfeldia incana]|nr:hypothetical protein HA466_0293410 [Hirschfeldia incana]
MAEERRLNFNAPLLSTRRMHNTAVSVRRNKSNNFTLDPNTTEMGLDEVTEAASVPFTWEQSPGRLKGHDDSIPQQAPDSTQRGFTPCLPPGNLSSRVKLVEEEEKDAFTDARDTLSYFSANHSITGVSGYGVVETKNPSGQDLQSRDFMLNRFLPAAKAMTVEQPHYGSNRKPSTFMPEPTIQIRELVPEEKRQNPNKYGESALVPYYNHHRDIDVEESEEEEDDEVYLSKRGCGMFPQLCFKESVTILKTVPDQAKSSKVSLLKSRFQFIKQLALDSVSKHKFGGKVPPTVHPNMTSAASMSSSPYRHTRCMSPFRNGSPFHPDTRKETESLRANRLNKHIRNISRSTQELLCPKGNASASSLLEKTVYVDTEDSPKTNIMIFPEEEEKKPDTNIELEKLGKLKNSPGRSPTLGPPSPKKPSESWLLHNLPSVVSSPSPSRRYTFNPQKQSFYEASRSVTKWETIVKTSYMHRDHIRYSEELVAHTSLQ